VTKKRVQLLPHLVTLGNAFCGLLALAKGVDALTLSGTDPSVFYKKMEFACFLIFLGMILDGLDGFVARLVGSSSEFGVQLDSFSDALTFGIVPPMLAKILIEHESDLVHYVGDPRLHFTAAAIFSLMAILRLARYNLEPESEQEVKGFRGLPSPAAAGTVAATIWLYLILRRPELERNEGTPTPLHRILGWMETVHWSPILEWVPVLLIGALPVLGLLMVSNVRYVHAVSYLTAQGQFVTLVGLVFLIVLLFLAPVPFLFLSFVGFTVSGLLVPLLRGLRSRPSPP